MRAGVSALLGLIFLVALTGEAYGAHDCPHHHAPLDEQSEVHSGKEGARTAAMASDSLPLKAPPDGPCTCVGNCHAASVALDAPGPPILPAAPTMDLALAFPAPDGRVPRAAAYLLPFANGPPIRLA